MWGADRQHSGAMRVPSSAMRGVDRGHSVGADRGHAGGQSESDHVGVKQGPVGGQTGATQGPFGGQIKTDRGR